MAEYVMTIGKKETFYIGPADLSTDKRLEIPVQNFQYPEFIRIENFDKELKRRVSDFFKDSEPIKILKTDDVMRTIHKVFIENKNEFDEFDRE